MNSDKEQTVKDLIGDQYVIGDDGKTVAAEHDKASQYESVHQINEAVQHLDAKNQLLRDEQDDHAESELFDDTATKVEVMPFNKGGVISAISYRTPAIVIVAILFVIIAICCVVFLSIS